MALIDDMSKAAAIAVSDIAGGNTPGSKDYARLVQFGEDQFRSYQKQGVAIPSLGPFEALGKAFAADALNKTFFSAKFGGTVSSFIDKAYVEVFGTAPSAAAKASLTDQVAYFDALYRGAGINPSDAGLQAKGAVLGQIIGYAFADPASALKTGLDDVVKAMIAKGDAGNFADFGIPLPNYNPPGGGGGGGNAVVIVPKSAIEDFELNKAVAEIFVANPNFYGNQLNKFVVGQDKIDLRAIAFGAGVVLDALTTMGQNREGFFISGGKQYAAVINSGGLYVDVNGNGNHDVVGDLFIQLVGTDGNPTGRELIFA